MDLGKIIVSLHKLGQYPGDDLQAATEPAPLFIIE
jgi:hypothetical protein